MHAADSVPSGSIALLGASRWLGTGWQGPALRAFALFVLGDVLPRAVHSGSAGWLSWLVLPVCYGLLVLAILRGLGHIQDAPEDEAPELDDAAASPAPLDAVVSLASQPAAKPRDWSLALLHALEWKRMGDLCLAFYRERELLAREVTAGADGSLEALLCQAGSEQPFSLLHCKARGRQEVDVEALQPLVQRMHEAGVERAFFMGAWRFSSAAKEFARGQQITLVDDRMFLALLGRLPQESSQRLLNLAVEGDYTTPTCPGCLLKMIPRQNGQGRYWGCRAYPHCKHTLGMHA
ncbi:restriction endonuclease [Uliginosibacterium sp. 31-12]|uniref:restriction endonuclease n=1 Tax=Uliginosibacterium sp. 31-12 TaxID=3062781 RepID=UPI0026E3AABB|nr:restriction endonuclease [Uliginosibacterium sp. 31-12]MDO6385915.1 restriction endonuclease [Uliginosibacterium sp. 31-12]